MDDFCDYLLDYIFSFIEIYELPVLKLVSKRWHTLINNLKIQNYGPELLMYYSRSLLYKPKMLFYNYNGSLYEFLINNIKSHCILLRFSSIIGDSGTFRMIILLNCHHITIIDIVKCIEYSAIYDRREIINKIFGFQRRELKKKIALNDILYYLIIGAVKTDNAKLLGYIQQRVNENKSLRHRHIVETISRYIIRNIMRKIKKYNAKKCFQFFIDNNSQLPIYSYVRETMNELLLEVAVDDVVAISLMNSYPNSDFTICGLCARGDSKLLSKCLTGVAMRMTIRYARLNLNEYQIDEIFLAAGRSSNDEIIYMIKAFLEKYYYLASPSCNHHIFVGACISGNYDFVKKYEDIEDGMALNILISEAIFKQDYRLIKNAIKFGYNIVDQLENWISRLHTIETTIFRDKLCKQVEKIKNEHKS